MLVIGGLYLNWEREKVKCETGIEEREEAVDLLITMWCWALERERERERGLRLNIQEWFWLVHVKCLESAGAFQSDFDVEIDLHSPFD